MIASSRKILRDVWSISVYILAILPCSYSVTPVYDETSWTKTDWKKWKIDRTHFAKPSDDAPAILNSYPQLRDVQFHSLDASLAKDYRDLQRQSSKDVDALDDVELAKPASQAVRCTVCHTLMSRVWRRAVDELLKGFLAPQSSKPELKAYFNQACAKEVSGLLKRKVIYKLDLEQTSQVMTLFVMRNRRQGTKATPAEQKAVQVACEDVLAADHNHLVAIVHKHLQDFQRSLDKHLRSSSKYKIESLFANIGKGKQGADKDSAAVARDMELAITKVMQEMAEMAAQKSIPTEEIIERARAALAEQLGGDAGVEVTGVDGATLKVVMVKTDMTTEDGAKGSKSGKESPSPSEPNESETNTVDVAVKKDKEGTTEQDWQRMSAKLLRAVAQQLRREGHFFRDEEEDAKATTTLSDEEEEYEDGPVEGSEEDPCADLHPMCERWANEGECSANPNYMVGNARLKGHCRKACGVCTPARPTSEELLLAVPELMRAVKELYTTLLKAAKAEGCTSRHSCLTGSSQLSAQQGQVRQKKRSRLDELMPQPHVPGGFVLGRPSWGIPQVKETPAAKDMYNRLTASSSPPQGDNAEGSKSSLQSQVSEVLGKELGGKLIQMHDDFFTYEYLYKNHTRQFHDEPRHSGKMTEDYVLGGFSRETVQVEAPASDGGGPAVLEPLDMLPENHIHMDMYDTAWPYLKQVYSNGDKCVLGNGKESVRRTEVRIACSPDKKLHLVVREPDFCHYIYVVYSPALCSIQHYKPVQRPQEGDHVVTTKKPDSSESGKTASS